MNIMTIHQKKENQIRRILSNFQMEVGNVENAKITTLKEESNATDAIKLKERKIVMESQFICLLSQLKRRLIGQKKSIKLKLIIL